MSWTGNIEVRGSHEHGYTIPAWKDGKTQARVVWKGENTVLEVEQYERVITDPRELLSTLGSIEQYVNLELVSASLEPREGRTTVAAQDVDS
jgi:hypothetical protein